MITKFYYMDNNNCRKCLCVEEKNNKYYCCLWCSEHKFANDNDDGMTREQLNEFLSNYGLSFNA